MFFVLKQTNMLVKDLATEIKSIKEKLEEMQ